MSLPAKVVLATGNAGKVKEFASLFAPLNIEVLPQSEFNVSSVPETGTTFVENGIIKARHAAQQTGLPAIADDSGLVVDALKGAPGIYSARYAGEDNILGDANVRYIEGINQLGIDPSDADGQDDVVTQELHLPVGRQVIFKLRSQDVLHSAYMPHFRAQMNVVPGMITQFSFTPTVTTEEIRQTDYMQDKMRTIQEIRKEKNKELVAAGEPALDAYDEFDYYLLCNKICGSSHYNMQMKIIVETEEEFNAWMAEQKTFKESVMVDEAETEEQVASTEEEADVESEESASEE